MTKQEYTVIKKFIQRVKRDLALEIRSASASGIDSHPIVGAINYMRGYMDTYEMIIKNDLKHSP